MTSVPTIALRQTQAELLEEKGDLDLLVDLSLVASETLEVVTSLIPWPPRQGDCPITWIYNDQIGPILLHRRCDQQEDGYQLVLSTIDPASPSFVYELAHELGHIMFGYRHSNALIETLCQALALTVLQEMSRRWLDRQDRPRPFSEPARLAEFADREIARSIRELHETGELASTDPDALIACVVEHVADLDEDPRFRNYARPTLAAFLLCRSEVPWPELNGISEATNPPLTADQYFLENRQSDLSQLTPDVRAALARIGRRQSVTETAF